jgi:glutathione peroxidase
MNLIKGLFLLTGIMALGAFLTKKLSATQPKAVGGPVYQFKLTSITGEVIAFERYRGKKLLIVNTASKCGKTPQYAGLQKLHEQYGDKVTVLGFPANNFLWQEPGSNEAIAEFCERNYGVTFQMFEKISVKGNDQHPLYAWLQSKTGHKPDWNFAKYLVSEDGEVVHFFHSSIQPMDPVVIEKITR